MQAVRKALLAHRESLLAKENVVGCGVAYKEVGGRTTNTACVVVLVEQKHPLQALAVESRVPSSLGNVPTDVVEVGRLRLLAGRTSRLRPARPGMSIGSWRISAGTLGAIVYDEESGDPLILSNNHVLANATNGSDGRSAIGDDIYQPGPADGGSKKDLIAHLTRFSPVFPNSSNGTYAHRPSLRAPRPQSSDGNLIDAAVAQPLEASMVSPNILEIGYVTETGSVAPGSQVKKSGRTTGLTAGVIRAVGVTVQVYLDEGRVARFVDQIVSSAMSEPGDSGSLGVTGDGKAFGLLFAGSALATIYNKIDNVLDLLHVRMSP